MVEDIRKILQAVANGEISPEEGEMLIKALKEKEEKKEEKEEKKEKKEEKKKEKIIIEENETFEDDIVFSGQNIEIKGKVKGDAVLLYCNTKFSGEVEGDLAVIGGKIEFDGGKVGGDLVLVGAKYEGREPEVDGDFVKVTNFLATSILTALSPILRGINIKSGRKKKKRTTKNFPFNSLPFEKSDEFIVDDEYNSAFVNVKKIIVKSTGVLNAKTVNAEEIHVEEGGILNAKLIICEKITGNGSVNCTKVVAKFIDPKLKISTSEIAEGE